MSAPPVTSYTIELIDTDADVVLLLLLVVLLVVLLLCVEDAVLMVLLLLTIWEAEDGSGVFVEIDAADDVGNDDVDVSEVPLFGDEDGNDDADVDVDADGDNDDDDGAEEVSEACAEVEEAAEWRLDGVGVSLGVSVTVLTDTVVAVADESVTVLYTICETVVGVSDSTTVETTVVCASAVLVGAEPPSTLTTA